VPGGLLFQPGRQVLQRFPQTVPGLAGLILKGVPLFEALVFESVQPLTLLLLCRISRVNPPRQLRLDFAGYRPQPALQLVDSFTHFCQSGFHGLAFFFSMRLTSRQFIC
jgi:hypothetical protein